MAKIVFITGTNYSGSTLLGLILGSHSKCEFIGEFNKRQNVATKGYEKAKEAGFCFFCEGRCPMMSRIGTYEDAFTAYPDKIFIDTSKKALWVKMHSKYDIRVIVINRNVDAVHESFLKRGRTATRKQIETKQKQKMKKVKRYNPLIVDYEDICHGSGIQKCCEFIGIGYEPEMREFWVKQHHGIGNKELIDKMRNGSIKRIK
jgi:hypothetical protein